MLKISLALPGAERNLTSEKAPATATPVPRLPFTSIITTSTITGNSAVVTAKLLEDGFLKLWDKYKISQHKSETAVHIAKLTGVIPSVKKKKKTELSTVISS